MWFNSSYSKARKTKKQSTRRAWRTGVEGCLIHRHQSQELVLPKQTSTHWYSKLKVLKIQEPKIQFWKRERESLATTGCKPPGMRIAAAAASARAAAAASAGDAVGSSSKSSRGGIGVSLPCKFSWFTLTVPLNNSSRRECRNLSLAHNSQLFWLNQSKQANSDSAHISCHGGWRFTRPGCKKPGSPCKERRGAHSSIGVGTQAFDSTQKATAHRYKASSFF